MGGVFALVISGDGGLLNLASNRDPLDRNLPSS
jgi:hypothetical protein